MTRDYMRKATMMDYTVFDIHYAAFARGKEHALEKMAKRKVRRKDKISLKKVLTTI